MPDFWHFASRPITIPFIKRAEDTYYSFSASGRSLFLFLAGLLLISSTALLYLLNERLLVTLPAYGGTMSEGIVGSPRFINPILAITDADHDLSALIYSGLLRATPDGRYTPDLAQDFSISDDGRTYSVTLRTNAVFHDGTTVTADDILFTVQKVQDSTVKSPLRASWDGILVKKTGVHTVQFILQQPYA